MHESRLVADLIARVESEVDLAETRVTHLSLRVGALSPVAPAALREGVQQQAVRSWGYAPEVRIDCSVEPDAPGSTSVTLETIRVED